MERPRTPTDSPEATRPADLASVPPTDTAVAAPDAQRTMLERVQRLVPIARSLIGKVRGLSVVSAVAAVVLWGILFAPWQWVGGASFGVVGLALVALLLLLLPAGAAYVGYLMLADVLDLPNRLRAAAAETTEQAVTAIRPSDAPKRQRLFGFFRAIWSARSLLLDSQGMWARALATVRLVRLASLPFVLGLLGAFALNFAVIGAALLALVLVAVF